MVGLNGLIVFFTPLSPPSPSPNTTTSYHLTFAFRQQPYSRSVALSQKRLPDKQQKPSTSLRKMFPGIAMEIFGQSYVPGTNNNVASLRGGQRLLQASAPEATDYQSVSFALIIGIFAMGGCAFAMMVTLAVKMRYHALKLKSLKLEMTKNNEEHAKYKIKRDAEIQGKWDTMVGAPSGTTTFVAGPDVYRPDHRGPVFEGC